MPWPMPRPRRSGALRRAQYARSQAKAVGHLLKAFAELHHRGCSNTKLGSALAQALAPAATPEAAPPQPAAVSLAASIAAVAPERPPGVFYPGVQAMSTTLRTERAFSIHAELIHTFKAEFRHATSFIDEFGSFQAYLHASGNPEHARNRAAKLHDVMYIIELSKARDAEG